MKGGILAAWLAGEGIVAWRIVHRDHSLPAPGVLLGIGALFIGGALLAEWVPKTEPLVLAVLVGLDVAALLDVLPAGLSGQIGQAQAATAAAEAPAAGEGSGGKL